MILTSTHHIGHEKVLTYWNCCIILSIYGSKMKCAKSRVPSISVGNRGNAMYLTICILGTFFLIIFENPLAFQIPSECPTVWVRIRIHVLSDVALTSRQPGA